MRDNNSCISPAVSRVSRTGHGNWTASSSSNSMLNEIEAEDYSKSEWEGGKEGKREEPVGQEWAFKDEEERRVGSNGAKDFGKRRAHLSKEKEKRNRIQMYVWGVFLLAKTSAADQLLHAKPCNFLMSGVMVMVVGNSDSVIY